MSCPKNLNKSEIIMEFGKSDNMGECNSCPNLKYENGLMTCSEISNSKKEDYSNENKKD